MSEDIDLFVTAADGGETSRITKTGDTSDPVWGLRSIAFANPFKRKGAPSEIWQIQPDGTGRTRITNSLPRRLVGQGHGGLVPIDWSEDGRALLAVPVSDSGSEPVAVDPETGAARKLGGTMVAERLNGATGPVSVVVPTRGFSLADVEGGDLWDPDADAAFVDTRGASLRAEIAFERVDTHVNDSAFADLVAERYLALVSAPAPAA